VTRYFFHVHNGPFGHIDTVGEELADLHAAWSEAPRYTGEVVRDIDGGLQPDFEWRLDVTDREGLPFYRIVVVPPLKRGGTVASSQRQRCHWVIFRT
jgi:hypothetical protein